MQRLADIFKEESRLVVPNLSEVIRANFGPDQAVRFSSHLEKIESKAGEVNEPLIRGLKEYTESLIETVASFSDENGVDFSTLIEELFALNADALGMVSNSLAESGRSMFFVWYVAKEEERWVWLTIQGLT